MKRDYLVAVATMASMGLSGAAFSQTPAASGELTLEEVVVTAERREENLQKVAATVTAISSEQLQDQGVRDITDLTRVAPQLVVQGGTFTNISQRGISTGSFSPVSEGTTAVHLDGAYISRFTGLSGFTFDTQRVEVVDGPQGTLYGRNATAGTINFITNRPADEFGGSASVELGNFKQRTTNVALNMPISATLKTRVAVYHNSGNGYYTNGEVDSLIDSSRASLLWKPTDRDELVVSYTDVHVGGQGGTGGSVIDRWIKTPTITQITAVNGAGASGAPWGVGYVGFVNPTTANGPIPCPSGTAVPAGSPGGTPAAAYTTTCVQIPFMPVAASSPWDNRVSQGWDSRSKVNTHNTALIAQYEHQFDFATLSASVSKQSTFTYNTTGSALGYAHGGMAFTAGWQRPAGPGFQTFHSNWESAEVHLSSKGEGQLKWIGGLYHFHDLGHDNIGVNSLYAVCYPLSSNTYSNPLLSNNINYCPSTVAVTTPPTAANGQLSPYGQVYMFRDVNGNPLVDGGVSMQQRMSVSADALFGQATWTPTFMPRAHLTLGARYNEEERYGKGYRLTARVTNPLLNWERSVRYTRVTYKANLAFDITDHNMVYVDRSTGFKSGGVGYGPTPIYEPEYLAAWELGSKNRFFNDKLQVNASAWYYVFTNRQVQGNDYVYSPANDIPTAATRGSLTSTALVNAADAVSKGQSLDVTWVFTPQDRVRLNVQHVESFYTDYDLTTRQTALYQNHWCTATADGAPNGAGGTCTGLNYYDPTNPDPLVQNARFLNLVPAGNNPLQTGTRINNTRPWSGNASYTHTFRLPNSSLETTLSLQYQGSIDKNGAVNSNGYLIMQPAYQSHDLNIRYRPNDSNWDLLLYARNFDNREYKTAVGFTTSAQNTANYLDPNAIARANYAYWTATYGAPRTYGVAINARF